jgi:hypothetical protein
MRNAASARKRNRAESSTEAAVGGGGEQRRKFKSAEAEKGEARPWRCCARGSKRRRVQESTAV